MYFSLHHFPCTSKPSKGNSIPFSSNCLLPFSTRMYDQKYAACSIGDIVVVLNVIRFCSLRSLRRF